ncbi:transposase (plasmid) [Mycoplasmatota bacterium]|nr:transposase [Mycoplasmatota bacterium]
MKLSFKFKPKFSSIQLQMMEELSFHTTKLYNIANYICREEQYKPYIQLEKDLKVNRHRDFLHSHTYQHCLKVLEKNWKSYFKSLADYKNHPHKYKGEPGRPKYKNLKDNKNEIIFTKLAIRFKNNQLMLSLSKTIQSNFKVNSLNFEVPDKLQSLVNWNSINQVKVKYDHQIKSWYLIIIYEKEELINHSTNVMAIDLGLNNLATLTFKETNNSYVVSGKKLKSINSYINKKIANLQSIEMKKHGSMQFKNTKRINNLRTYRENYVLDYLHKVSYRVIKLAEEHQVGKIIIGDLTDIKQGVSYNKLFVQIPIQKLANMIEYKAKLNGLKIEYQEESYTSGCSAVDLEPVTNFFYNKKRRIHRGLFESSIGTINADVNGSLNILRKNEECIPKIVLTMRDKGYVFSPVRIRVAC